MKKIVIVVGSPRKGGNTHLLAQAFEKGAKEAGNEVDVIEIANEKIAPCLGCNHCYGAAHECAIRDDMQSVADRLKDAEVLVFATPIYFYGVSAQLKTMIDRLHNPVRSTFKVKKLALLAVCADDREEVFDSVKAMYRAVLSYFKLEDGGIVTAHGVKDKGDIAGNTAIEKAELLGRNI